MLSLYGRAATVSSLTLYGVLRAAALHLVFPFCPAPSSPLPFHASQKQPQGILAPSSHSP